MARGNPGLHGVMAGVLALAACTSPVTVPRDEATGIDEVSIEVPDSRPPGFAAIRFAVDDTANKTYGDKEMKWTGSFAWNEADNTIAYASSWLPTDGPFPWLYDDGPRSADGHEPEGAVKGDHVFETEVLVKAEEDLTFEYGVLNELDRWIWIGPNGVVTIPAGSTDTVDAARLIVPSFGEVDLKLTLDLKALHPNFATITLADYDVYLKSSANSWTPVQLLDDGDASLGDETAGDGVVTFVQSKRLGGHDGRLRSDQHAQFVFVFAIAGFSPDDGQEYKAAPTVLAEGVRAYTDAAVPGTFAEVPVIWERAARGKEFNTTVVVDGGKAWCAEDGDCYGNVACGADGCDAATPPPVSTPAISGVEPATGPAAGGTPIVLTGTDFLNGATVTIGGVAARNVAFVSATEVRADTPPHKAGLVDVVLRNPDGGTDTATAAFTFTDEEPPQSTPGVTQVVPAEGPVTGGTEVTLSGQDLRDGCTVTFDGIAATNVTFVSGTQVKATTPAHAKGAVDVVLTNPDGGMASLTGGFTYTDGVPPKSSPMINYIDPQKVPVSGGTEVTLSGRDFQEGCTVAFGGIAATALRFVSATEVKATTPAHAQGTVDVELTNPDEGTYLYANAFEFVEPKPPEVVDWGRLDAPLTLDVRSTDPMPDVFAEAYEPGVTVGGGGDGLVAAEVGWGPPGSDPREAGTGWTWVPATYDGPGGDTGNNAIFQGTLGPVVGGTYAYTFRFSLDSGTTWLAVDSDGASASGTDFSTTSLGTLTLSVPDPEAPVLSTIVPDFGLAAGGGTVTATGQRLTGVTKVLLGSAEAAASVNAEGTSLTFTVPAHEPAVVAIEVTNGAGKTARMEDAFAFVPKTAAPPTLDGTIDGDWDASFRVAANGLATDWADNTLGSLWVAYDQANLYIGVAGNCTSDNAIAAYLDLDFGVPATGPSVLGDPANGLKDVTGALDNALSSLLNVTAPGFGADVAVGTKGMAGVAAGTHDAAGWRGFHPPLGTPGDFAWIGGPAVTATGEKGGLEASIPWASIVGGTVPPRTTLAIVVRLVFADGESCSNQSLPQIGGGTWTQNQVVQVPIR